MVCYTAVRSLEFPARLKLLYHANVHYKNFLTIYHCAVNCVLLRLALLCTPGEFLLNQ